MTTEDPSGVTVPRKVVFVCYGNIIRSKAAAAFAAAFSDDHPSLAAIRFDSAGVSTASATGEDPDSRMVGVLAQRGFLVSGVSRRIRASDFARDVHLVFMTRALVRHATEITGLDPLVLQPQFVIMVW